MRAGIRPRHQLSAQRARPAMPSSNAASSCWQAAGSSPSRVWEDSIWPAMLPTNKRCASCAVASVAATSHLPSWFAVLPMPGACVISTMLNAICSLAVSAPLCCCAGALLARATAVPPTSSLSRHLSRTTFLSSASCSPIRRFNICCLPRQKPAVCMRSS